MLLSFISIVIAGLGLLLAAADQVAEALLERLTQSEQLDLVVSVAQVLQKGKLD
jgi:hypothetical protein